MSQIRLKGGHWQTLTLLWLCISSLKFSPLAVPHVKWFSHVVSFNHVPVTKFLFNWNIIKQATHYLDSDTCHRCQCPQSVPTDAPSHKCHTNSYIMSQLVPINANRFLADITNGHYFIWQISLVTSCWLHCHVNIGHSPNHPHTGQSRSRKWQMTVFKTVMALRQCKVPTQYQQN